MNIFKWLWRLFFPPVNIGVCSVECAIRWVDEEIPEDECKLDEFNYYFYQNQYGEREVKVALTGKVTSKEAKTHNIYRNIAKPWVDGILTNRELKKWAIKNKKFTVWNYSEEHKILETGIRLQSDKTSKNSQQLEYEALEIIKKRALKIEHYELVAEIEKFIKYREKEDGGDCELEEDKDR